MIVDLTKTFFVKIFFNENFTPIEFLKNIVHMNNGKNMKTNAFVSNAIPNIIALVINKKYFIFPFFSKEYSKRRNENIIKK